MSEPIPPTKLEYQPRDSEQFRRTERKRIALLYVKRTIIAILLPMGAIVAFWMLYTAVYFFSGGDTMSD